MKSILFVCLGNICRSPLAEGILRKKLAEKNIDIFVDSAGMLSYHVGHAPDSRAIKTAQLFGLDISGLRGRQFSSGDFKNFDLILPMDIDNKAEIISLARTSNDTSKVKLCLEFAGKGKNAEVPDPYYGHLEDFVDLYHLLDEACDQMILKLQHS